MNRSIRAALPHLTMNEAWGELKLNGQLLRGIRPRSRGWRLLKVFMADAPNAASADKLFTVCTTVETVDPKGAVYDAIRRLREALARAVRGGSALLQTCDDGGWRVAARCSLLDGAPSIHPISNTSELTLR